MKREIPTFGSAEPGIAYRSRRAAYAIIRNAEGAIATVRVPAGYWLPGGGALDGETSEETITREVREELGDEVTALELIGEAVQYFHAPSDNAHYRMHATFFRAELAGTRAGRAEHEVLWLDPNDPGPLFFHACHDWAARMGAGSDTNDRDDATPFFQHHLKAIMNDTEANIAPSYEITSVAELEALYGVPVPRSLIKELEQLSDHYRTFIEKSPFVVIATSGPEGLDCSPRGDPPGFVRVADRKTVMIPDRRGNNRLDTLHNIVRDPRVALLFLIPGVGETLRINGRARLVTDPALCETFEMEGKAPKSVLVVTIDRVYYQCQKAIARGRLWSDEARIDRSELPTAGQMLEAMSADGFDGGSYDTGYPEYMKKTMY